MTTPRLIKSIVDSPFRLALLLIPLVFACFALLQRAQAVVPAPDGGYAGFTTAEGTKALNFLTTGAGNTGIGWYSLFSAGDASFNTGVGAGTLALTSGTGSQSNTAVGTAAMILNTTGDLNTAVGAATLVNNNDGFFNDAVGAYALNDNIVGFGNNAFGESALLSNQTASENTAIGDVALAFNDSSGNGLANNNTAVGGAALEFNTDGSENTAVGTGAGQNVVAGFNNTYVGQSVGTGVGDENSTIRIGDLSGGNSQECYIGGIFNNFQPVGGTVVEVTLDLSNDHLGWDIGPSQRGSAPAVPRSAPARRGAPDAPTRPAMLNGKVGRVEKLEATVAQQQKQIETLTARLKEQAETFAAQLKEQADEIQKVSAQLEASKPAPQMVNNP